jgi:hypothetical protein
LDEKGEKSREKDLLVVVTVCAFEKHRKDASRRRSNMEVKGKCSLQYYLSNDGISSVYFFSLVIFRVFNVLIYKNLTTAVDLGTQL